MSGSTWLTRYRNGERSQVWHELRQLGATIDDPVLVENAQLVCDEMAALARRNIQLIVERLRRDGYRFQRVVGRHAPAVAGIGVG